MTQKHKIILATVLLLLALIRIVTWVTESSDPPEASKHYQAMGQQLAVEVSGLLNNAGTVVTVSEDTPRHQLRVKTFTHELEQQDFTVQQIIAGPGDYHPDTGLSLSFYQRLSRDFPQADAVVSFVTSPPVQLLEDRNLTRLTSKFITVLPSMETLRAFFQEDLVHLALVPAGNVENPELDPGASHQEWFDNFYRILHPADAQSLPAPRHLPGTSPEEELEFVDDLIGEIQ